MELMRKMGGRTLDGCTKRITRRAFGGRIICWRIIEACIPVGWITGELGTPVVRITNGERTTSGKLPITGTGGHTLTLVTGLAGMISGELVKGTQPKLDRLDSAEFAEGDNDGELNAET